MSLIQDLCQIHSALLCGRLSKKVDTRHSEDRSEQACGLRPRFPFPVSTQRASQKFQQFASGSCLARRVPWRPPIGVAAVRVRPAWRQRLPSTPLPSTLLPSTWLGTGRASGISAAGSGARSAPQLGRRRCGVSFGSPGRRARSGHANLRAPTTCSYG